MRRIKAELIINQIAALVQEINVNLPVDVKKVLKTAWTKEKNKIAKDALSNILENTKIAKKDNIALCQDTGSAVFFIDIGNEVQIKNSSLEKAINDGVKKGYKEGFLRKSIVDDPLFERINTKTNTPSIIHYNIVKGDKIKISLATKGGGAENMSRISMMKPADGVEGVKNFVLETVRLAGPNPCPPIIVGIGIGGNFEYSAYLAKKALLRKIGVYNKNKKYMLLEKELLVLINKEDIGVQGFGGNNTCLAVHIEYYPCHIASLPVALNIQCHSARHKSIII